MSNLINRIVGRRISASIGEPWDFESEAGQNRLEGTVIAISESGEYAQWCLCDVSAFTVAENRITKVGIVDRYAEGTRLPERLARGERVGANFVYDASGRDLTPATLTYALATKSGLAFLAGSVQVLAEE